MNGRFDMEFPGSASQLRSRILPRWECGAHDRWRARIFSTVFATADTGIEASKDNAAGKNSSIERPVVQAGVVSETSNSALFLHLSAHSDLSK